MGDSGSRSGIRAPSTLSIPSLRGSTREPAKELAPPKQNEFDGMDGVESRFSILEFSPDKKSSHPSLLQTANHGGEAKDSRHRITEKPESISSSSASIHDQPLKKDATRHRNRSTPQLPTTSPKMVHSDSRAGENLSIEITSPSLQKRAAHQSEGSVFPSLRQMATLERPQDPDVQPYGAVAEHKNPPLKSTGSSERPVDHLASIGTSRRLTARATSLGSLRTTVLIPDYDLTVEASRNRLATTGLQSQRKSRSSFGVEGSESQNGLAQGIGSPTPLLISKEQLDSNGSGATSEEAEEVDAVSEMKHGEDSKLASSSRRKTIHHIGSGVPPDSRPVPDRRRGSFVAGNGGNAGAGNGGISDNGRFSHDVAISKLTGHHNDNDASTVPLSPWRKLLKALSQTEVEQNFDEETTQQYYNYYYKAYKRQWQVMDVLAIIIACFFLIWVFWINVRNFDDKIGLVAVLAFMTSIPVIELIFTFTRFHRKYALRAHLVMLFGYGVALGAMELYMQSINPPGYMFLFLLLMYTDIGCQPFQALGFIGVSATAVDTICLYIAVKQNVGLQALCDQSAPCGAKIAATAILYTASNVFGIIYALMSWKYTRKTFLTHRNLMINQKKLTEGSNKAENIALSILPAKVWNELRGGKHQRFETGMITLMHKNIMYRCRDVTVVFGDIVGFTNLSGTVTSTELVGLLNEIFFDFDQHVEKFGCEKIKTIGDCYMLCSGVPEPVFDHELRAVAVGLKMVESMRQISLKHSLSLAMRIGAHTGDVMAGLIGEEKLIFDVWSKDVSIASYMEQSGKPLRVHVSEKLKERLGTRAKFTPGPVCTIYENSFPTFFVEEILDQDGIEQILQSVRDSVEGAAAAVISEAAAANSTAKHGRLARVLDSRPVSGGPTRGGNSTVAPMPISRVMSPPMTSMITPLPPNRNGHDNPYVKTEPPMKAQSAKSEISQSIRWYDCRFKDDAMESEFQINFVAKYSGKFSIGVLICIFTSFMLLLVDIIIFRDPAKWFPMLAIIIIESFILSIYLTTLRTGGVPTNDFVKLLVDLNGTLNTQIIGPFTIFVVYIGIALLLIKIDAHLYQYVYAQLYVLLMAGTAFTRLRMVNIAGVALIIIITFHAFTIAASPVLVDVFDYMIIFYQVLILLAIILVTRRMEMYIRTNYLAKKDLVQKKYEIDDMRIKSERMLYKLLPKAVVERISANPNKEIADGVAQAGILFCTICNFKQIDPETMQILNDIISKFDRMTIVYEVEKIKSIGTTYMAASGLMRNFESLFNGVAPAGSKAHYIHLANFALALRSRMIQLNNDYSAASLAKGGPPANFKLRIGIDVGPVVAGVIGKSKFAYDIWGEHVNLASRMDSTGAENHIQLTERAYEVLKNDFILEHRGTVEVKGKGPMLTWW